MLVIFALFTHAQEDKKGDLQIGVQGGVSLPIGNYKTVPNTKTGYFSGLFVDKYFNGNKFGLGVDARFINNGINKQDSFHFDNGYIETIYTGKARFQDYLFTFGPSYKFTNNKFHLEAYVRAGIMMQEFPQYATSIIIETKDPSGGLVTSSTLIKQTVNDVSNKANAWAGLAGLRFNYSISKNFAIFAHVDYVQALGKKIGSKASTFNTEYLIPDETNPITDVTTVQSVFNHFTTDTMALNSVYHQTINAGLGVKYIFGRPRVVKKEMPVQTQPVVMYDDLVQPVVKAKDLQIVVKDKQTNLSLGGVTVSMEGNGMSEKSITDANGQATKILSIVPGTYTIYGDKNGIKTPVLTLTEADFNANSPIIFKEIYHDDPRFTLVGETFDCNLQRFLPEINTVLTNSSSLINSSQTSDGLGKFIYQLEPQSDYTVMANQEGRYSQTELVTTKGLNRSQTLFVTLKLGVCDLVKNDVWVLKNILYDFDKSDIRPDAALILDNVVAVMHKNPTLRIELSSHTDSRGNDNYNMKLSQRRAEAAVNYLVSQGIQKSRLIAQGYGESRLVNGCANGVNCSEAQHQENRRTEIKILDYSK